MAAAESPGRLPGGRPRRRGLPGAASAVVQAFRRLMATISSLGPTWSVKERAPRQITAKGPSYSGCSGGTAPPRRIQTRGAERSSAGSSLGRLELELVLGLGKE